MPSTYTLDKEIAQDATASSSATISISKLCSGSAEPTISNNRNAYTESVDSDHKPIIISEKTDPVVFYTEPSNTLPVTFWPVINLITKNSYYLIYIKKFIAATMLSNVYFTLYTIGKNFNLAIDDLINTTDKYTFVISETATGTADGGINTWNWDTTDMDIGPVNTTTDETIAMDKTLTVVAETKLELSYTWALS